MRHRNTQKKYIMWVLLAALILSGIHSVKTSAVIFLHAENGIPLSQSACQPASSRLYRDMCNSEIIGADRTRTVLQASLRNRGRQLFYFPYVSVLTTNHNSFSLMLKTVLTRYLETENSGISKIIRYIHNQDGEKGISFPKILGKEFVHDCKNCNWSCRCPCHFHMGILD
ncbi:MAG: hypothetical protein J1F22_01040 [Lachnospiraceae bacterium]|nr:hypothetical protein [Lachnospiraceae bacterium]